LKIEIKIYPTTTKKWIFRVKNVKGKNKTLKRLIFQEVLIILMTQSIVHVIVHRFKISKKLMDNNMILRISFLEIQMLSRRNKFRIKESIKD
jgi:hypothetical protein